MTYSDSMTLRDTTHTTKVTGYHRRLALPCLGKAYCSNLSLHCPGHTRSSLLFLTIFNIFIKGDTLIYEKRDM